ncbi:MAG TPA: J domain-containing protein [Bryobacteraceae bacterium]|nr:J domain-containing protein [Bryobacteraceae bacterium]
MDYYQQLGVGQHASDDEVRRAYRRLTKLVHPDQYADSSSKQMAEALMRRINVISDTLLDPNQRYLYDEGPSGPTEPTVPHGFEWHSMRWWAIGAIAAIALTLSAVWFWADSFGSSFAKSGSSQVSASSSTDTKASTDSQDVIAPASLEDTRLAARSGTDQHSKVKP